MAPIIMTSTTAPTSTTSPPTSPSTSGPRSRIRGFVSLRSHTQAAAQNASQQSTQDQGGATSPVTSNSPASLPPLVRSSTTPIISNNLTTNVTSAWLPTVGGVSGLSRVPTAPAAESSTAVGGFRSASAALPPPTEAPPTLSRSDTVGPTTSQATESVPATPSLPSIRFVPHIDLRPSRPSLSFPPMERVLRHPGEIIKVGRYSDRDAGNPFPLGFKSKVVSRRHCEFWYENNQWFVKDVKSSSGTFLNHVRLSSPGVESKAFPLFDGDILQLGIDFKGGEETIFRCVKMRVELNRVWQKGLNSFNISTHNKLRNLNKETKVGETGAAGDDKSDATSSECSICLMNIAPCQGLFVAPCSHVWHYKCVRPIILKNYPSFLCPNCRAVHDLEREIEEEDDESQWEKVEETQNVSLGDGAPIDRTGTYIGMNNAANSLLMVDPTHVVDAVVAGNNPEALSSTSSDPTGALDTVANGLARLHLSDGSLAAVSNSAGGDATLRARPQGVQTIMENNPFESSMAVESGASTRNRVVSAPLLSTHNTPHITREDDEGVSTPTFAGNLHISLPPNPLSFGLDHDMNGLDGPLTPRNTAGPFILDGTGRG